MAAGDLTFRALSQRYPGLGRGEIGALRMKLLADEAEARVGRLQAKLEAERAVVMVGADGLCDPAWLVRSVFREVFSQPEDFLKRSLLRRRERENRRNPPHDAHVRVYYEFPPTARAAWVCRACGKTMRHLDRGRSKSGYLTSHCGCRTGKIGRDAHPNGKARRNELKRLRRAVDPAYAMDARLSGQIRGSLRGMKAGRSWESIVGYTLSDLVEHFTRMLPEGKALADCIEGWHIDHIVPRSAYDFSVMDDVRACWCLSNLRLIPGEENVRKSDKREFLL